MATLQFLLDVVVAEDLELIQPAMKTAFLHSDLKEEIYLEQPKGFIKTGRERLVCWIKKSLYGLKQVPRQWYKKFDDFIQLIDFSKSNEDRCLF